jgi:hypothetical protein
MYAQMTYMQQVQVYNQWLGQCYGQGNPQQMALSVFFYI